MVYSITNPSTGPIDLATKTLHLRIPHGSPTPHPLQILLPDRQVAANRFQQLNRVPELLSQHRDLIDQFGHLVGPIDNRRSSRPGLRDRNRLDHPDRRRFEFIGLHNRLHNRLDNRLDNWFHHPLWQIDWSPTGPHAGHHDQDDQDPDDVGDDVEKRIVSSRLLICPLSSRHGNGS